MVTPLRIWCATGFGPAVEAKPVAQEAEPVAPAAAASEPKAAPAPAPAPVPPVREKEPAMAGADSNFQAEVERSQGLAAKLRKWFGRG